MRMVVSLNLVSIIIICLGGLSSSISVRDTILSSLVAPQDLTVTSNQVNPLPPQSTSSVFILHSGSTWDW